MKQMKSMAKMSNEAIINHLLSDLNELIDQRKEFEENDLDGFYDYLGGTIDRTQMVLGLLGVPLNEIPQEDEEQMSDPTATVDTMNKCYQCEDELTYEPVDEVHPLCSDCQNEFDDWLQYQMGMFA